MFKTSILNKLFIIYAVLVSVTLACIFFVITFFVQNKEKEFLLSFTENTRGQLSVSLDRAEKLADNFTENIYTEESMLNDLYIYLTHNFPDYQEYHLDYKPKEFLPTPKTISYYINKFFLNTPSLASITLYSSSLNRLSIYTADNISHNITVNESSNLIDKDISETLTNFPYLSDFPFTYSRKIPLRFAANKEAFGFIILEYDILSPTIATDHFLSNMEFYLLNKEGIPIASSDDKLNIESKKSISHFYLPWKDTGLTLEARIYSDYLRIKFRKVITIFGVSFLIILSLLLYIFYKSLKKLECLFEDILHSIECTQKGDLSYKIDTDSYAKDELTLIALQLNRMNEQLDNYIREVYIAESKQKQAYILALQNQINPHFLYNTLEIIRMQALMEGNRAVGTQISHLARLHRNLVKGDPYVPLRKEIEFCRAYIGIQQIRYGDQLQYVVDCKPEVMSYNLPKFLLQPLVENYFKHGFDAERKDNIMECIAFYQDDLLKIYIRNNGKPLPKEVEANFNNKLMEEADSYHIGLLNIKERIQLEYGKEYGLSVENEVGYVTFVITLPKKGLKRYENSAC